MNRLLLMVITMSTILFSQPASTGADLRKQLESLIRSRQGEFAVAFSDLTTGERLLINERTSFHAASTMKTPVMIEIYRQAAAHILSLDDSVDVRNSFRSIVDGSEYALDLSDDSDDGLYRFIGKKQTIRELVFKMITVSSNLATNILIEMAGPENIMRTMREMGCNDIRVRRGVEDGKAFAAGLNNTTTAYDLMLIFEQLAQKKVVDAATSEGMLAVLRAQKFRDMIPALLPPDVLVAHKTGSITNVQHDSGIITLPDGRQYVLVLLSRNLKNNKDGIEVLALLSKAVHDFVRK
ncbi:MAG: serine hydrolase [Bacteroidetes bacterium]|nr:serine hydrolase [Bacteroidota bacterium]